MGTWAATLTGRRDRRGRRRAFAAAAAVLFALGASGCSGVSDGDGADATGLTVTSERFDDGSSIPDEYTCRGTGDFPGIAWEGDVGGASALAVVVDDPDAPNGTYYHLVVLDLPVTTTTLTAALPDDATVALNSDGSAGWTPPCPPSGEHHYRFTVYALSRPTGLDAEATPEDAIAAIDDSTVAEGTLTGLVSS